MIVKLVLKHLGNQDWSEVAYHESGNIGYSTARRGKGRTLRALVNGAKIAIGAFRRRKGANVWERRGWQRGDETGPEATYGFGASASRRR